MKLDLYRKKGSSLGKSYTDYDRERSAFAISKQNEKTTFERLNVVCGVYNVPEAKTCVKSPFVDSDEKEVLGYNPKAEDIPSFVMKDGKMGFGDDQAFRLLQKLVSKEERADYAGETEKLGFSLPTIGNCEPECCQ